MIIQPGLDVQHTRFGGTGIDSVNPMHTKTLPHRLEAGTINLAGIDFVASEGMEAIHRQEMSLLARLRDGLSELNGIDLFCTEDLSDPDRFIAGFRLRQTSH